MTIAPANKLSMFNSKKSSILSMSSRLSTRIYSHSGSYPGVSNTPNDNDVSRPYIAEPSSSNNHYIISEDKKPLAMPLNPQDPITSKVDMNQLLPPIAKV